MQKVTDFLEQHVQWIAIGLGALFCLFMIWSYVITPPAEVVIGSETYGPSEIDPHTASTVAAQLQGAMNTSAKIRMEVPQYVQAFQNAMAWENAEPVQLAGLVDPAYTRDVLMPEVPKPEGAPPTPPPTGQEQFVQNIGDQKITALPVPPTPVYVDVKYGRTMIIPPLAPGQPAPPPPMQPGEIPPNAVDRDWVTQMWKVSMNDIESAFRKAGMQNVPPQMRTTSFLQVEMVRQEMVDGQWTNEKVIPPLEVTRNNQPRMPWPGEGKGPAFKGQQFAYAMWAAQNTPDIIQPIFHQTVPNKGDQWSKPGEQVVAPAMFDPAAHVGGKGNLSDEQWQQVLRYRQEQYKLRQEQQRNNQGPRTPRTPGGERGFPPDMIDFAPLQRNYAPPPRPYGPRGGGYGGMPPDLLFEGEFMGEFGPGGYGAMPQAPGLPQPGTDYPTGDFDPLSTQPQPWKGKEIEIWAHDDQVEPGKTYRYKMRYKMKNPIFGAGANIANPPELVDQFALVSEFSDWTPSLRVPSLVNFFVAGGGLGNRGTVDFEVFRWDQGQQKRERFTVGPGDLVGWEKNGVDFSTDWTVVDFRQDPRTNDTQILLVNDEDGSVVARSYQADNKDPLYQGLKKQVEDAKAAEAAAAAAAGGVVVPGGPGAAFVR